MKKLIDLFIGFAKQRKINVLGAIIWSAVFHLVAIVLLHLYWDFVVKPIWNLW